MMFSIFVHYIFLTCVFQNCNQLYSYVGCWLCNSFCSPQVGKLARTTPSPLVQKGAALKISGSLEIAACWHSAPGLWGWPWFRFICNKHFVHKPYLMQYIYFSFLGFRVWVIKPTNTYIAHRLIGSQIYFKALGIERLAKMREKVKLVELETS